MPWFLTPLTFDTLVWIFLLFNSCRSSFEYAHIWAIWSHILFLCTVLFWHSSVNKVPCIKHFFHWQIFYLLSWSSGKWKFRRITYSKVLNLKFFSFIFVFCDHQSPFICKWYTASVVILEKILNSRSVWYPCWFSISFKRATHS